MSVKYPGFVLYVPAEQVLHVPLFVMLKPVRYWPAGQGTNILQVVSYSPTVSLYLPSSQLVHVPAKGGGDETVCNGDTTAARVRDWLAARPDSADGALFVSLRRARFTRQALYFLVKRRGAAAGIVAHPHLLRHRRVGDVVERMGLDVGRGFARHSHTSTTANVYGGHAVQVIHQRIREAGDPLAGRVGA